MMSKILHVAKDVVRWSVGITDLPGIGTSGHVLKIKMFWRTNIQYVNWGAHLASNECDIHLKILF